MLNSVSENNLDLANSWSNVLAKYNKLWPVMPYNLFKRSGYEAVWRLNVGSHGVASVKGTLFPLMKDAELVHQ
jgi:spore coat protein U-like protein